MDAGLIDGIERALERGASVLFAAAAGYAAYGLVVTLGLRSPLALCAAGVGALAYLPCSRLLGIGDGRSASFNLPRFVPREFDFIQAPDELLLTDRMMLVDELVLTEADGLDAEVMPAQPAPLVLDDVLDQIDPDARVVRLFDRKAMPATSPASAQDRSHHTVHLSYPSDASQALSAALAELRRSLR